MFLLFFLSLFTNINLENNQIVLTDTTNDIFEINRKTNFTIENVQSDFLLIVENQATNTYGSITQETTKNSASWMGYYGKYLIYIPKTEKNLSLKIKPFEKNINHAKVRLTSIKLDNPSKKFKQALRHYINANDLRIRQYLGDKAKIVEAINLFKQAKQLFVEEGQEFYMGLSSFELGIALGNIGKNQESIKELSSAIIYWNNDKYKNQRLQTQNYKGLALWKTQRLDNALELFKRNKQEYETSNNTKLLSSTLNNIGLIYWEQSNIHQAQKYYNQALQIQNVNISKSNSIDSIVSNPNLLSIVSIINNLALTHDALGEPKIAEQLWEYYLKFSKNLTNKENFARAKNNISLLYLNKFLFNEAKLLIEESIHTFEKSNSKRWLSLAIHNLGQIYLQLGLYNLAEIQFNKAIGLRDKVNNPKGLIDSQLKLLEIYLKQNKFNENELLSNTSLRLATSIKYDKAVASIHLNNFLISMKNTDFENANKNINKAIEVAQGKSYKRFLSKLNINKARLLLNISQSENAIIILKKEITSLQTIWDTKLLNTANNLLSRAYIQKKDYPSAEKIINSELANIAFYIDTSTNNKIRNNLARMLKQTLSIFNVLSIHQNNPKQGFNKTNQMLSVFKKTDNHSSNTGLHQIPVDDLLTKISDKTLALENVTLSNNDKQQIENGIIELKAKLDFSYSASKKIKYTDIDLDLIQSKLAEDTLILQFSIGESGGVSWWITKNKFESYILEGNDYYSLLIKAARNELLTISGPKLTILSQKLLAPLESFENIKKIKIITDEPLNLIPFNALLDPRFQYKNTVIDSNSIQRISSINSSLTNGNNTLTNLETLIIADPVTSQIDTRLEGVKTDKNNSKQFNRLIGTNSEAKNIAKLNEAKLLLGFEATKSKFLTTNFQNINILHIATHAFFHPEISGLSSLVFSSYDKNGNSQSSFLRALEISNMQFNNELIVLSGCETGISLYDDALGLNGLTHSFIQAGSKNLIASLWKVGDRTTEKMMFELYKGLNNGLSIADALHQAQKLIKSNPRTRHPKYWAGWFLLSN